MNDNTLQKLKDAITLIEQIDKLNGELNGELMDTYDDIVYDLREFNRLCRVFSKFEEFDAGIPSSTEFETLLCKALGKDS